jgi:hypothetical protein
VKDLLMADGGQVGECDLMDGVHNSMDPQGLFGTVYHPSVARITQTSPVLCYALWDNFALSLDVSIFLRPRSIDKITPSHPTLQMVAPSAGNAGRVVANLVSRVRWAALTASDKAWSALHLSVQREAQVVEEINCCIA